MQPGQCLIIRSHHGGYTASHPNCEVKHHGAQSVLRWGTTRESWVSNVFFLVNFFTFFFVVKFFCFTHFFLSQNLRLCGLFCFEFSPTLCKQTCGEFSAFHWFFRLKIQRMQNAPPNQGKKKSRKKKQTGKPRLNLTRSLQQGNSR